MTLSAKPSSIGQWLKHLLVYGLGIASQQILSFLLVFVYTRRIPPSEYGVLELLNRGQDVLGLIVLSGFGVAALAFYQFEVSHQERRVRVFSTALGGILLNSLVLLACLLPFAPRISDALFGTPQYGWAVSLILVIIPLELVFQIGLVSLQAEFKSVLYVTASAGRFVLGLAVNLVLVYWLHWGLWGILLATLLHTGLSAAGLGIYVLRRGGWSFERKLWMELLRYGLPFIPGGVFMFVLNSGDRYFLSAFHGPVVVGIYSVGYKFGSILTAAILAPFMKVWSAMMVETANREDGPREVARLTTYLVAAYVYAGVVFGLLAPAFIRWVTSAGYWESHRVIPVVLVAYLFYCLSVLGDAPFYAKKKTEIKPVILGATCVVCLGFYALLIPRFAGMGAAWATVLGFGFFALLTIRVGQRYLPIPYEWGRLLKLAGLAVLVYGAGSWAAVGGWLSDVAAAAIGLAIFPALLVPLQFWTGGEIQAVSRSLSSVAALLRPRVSSPAGDRGPGAH